jgi:DNA mismatch repair protein MutS2
MRTVIGMLRHVTPDSLVLLDELGAGTDPQEGSALARALISTLLERGALVVATTHYSEVKAYAYATPGVENASVEFDVESLAPTYRLMIGVPGRSNALAIARRLGMPREIVDAAATLVDPDEVRADSLLQDIRRRRDEADATIARARETEQEAQQLRRIAARELREANQERQAARAEALAEAEAELAEVRDALRRLQRDRETVAATREHVEQRRQEVERATEAVRTFRRERIARPAPVPGARPIRAGDRVRITALGQEGEVASVADGNADVLLGSLKLRQPLDALERLGRAPATSERRVFKPPAPDPVSIEIDLRGHRAAEIEGMLDRYLEDAYRQGLPFVRIIHGKGRAPCVRSCATCCRRTGGGPARAGAGGAGGRRGDGGDAPRGVVRPLRGARATVGRAVRRRTRRRDRSSPPAWPIPARHRWRRPFPRSCLRIAAPRR